ncbi:glycosyltransferase [Amycolatopsis sp. PS_44_ISF1]|uniref:glycosyltransferase n=1 Tax=Amycolatopsis sp. PS_44_ISF1 TaxID=2974917 RepID=UPI0028DFA031|nr:glycosyltransferase [Amycolatopsis sp. PS_44_ISF1]MDT8909979.1 glycosyltransferase [Amycolatopsis sp. PS_44_ISF1]
MRFLFTFAGGRGHFDPMAPIARALAAAGHTVAVAAAGREVPAVERAGFPAFATSPAPEADPGAPVRKPMPPVDPARDDWEMTELFARRGGRERAGALLEIARDWRPDLVVRDEADFGSAIAAERLGLPRVTVLVLAAGTFPRRELLAEPWRELRAEHGLAPDPALARLDGDLVLSSFPPGFRDPGSAFLFRTGPPPVPSRAHEPPGVYFTLGTNFNLESGDLFERGITGLAQLDARVTVTVGAEIDPAVFGPQPDHVRVERFVPQAELLPDTDLVVSHGGSGGLMGAFSHGLPSLVFPLGADQPSNARRGAELGVTRALDPQRAGPGEIRDAAAELLGSPRDAVLELQAQIAAMPGPEATVAVLEGLALTSAPGSPRPAP